MGRSVGLQAVDLVMKQALGEGVFPGAVLWVGHQDQVLFHRAYGIIDAVTRQPVTKATLFDLASLTKPLATALAMIYLVQELGVDLESALADMLPEFQAHPLGTATLEQLLRHRGGWAAYHPLYKGLAGEDPVARKEELRQSLVELAPHDLPGKQTLYSDLGFMALDWVVERRTGQTLDRVVQAHFYGPLKTEELFFPGLHCGLPKVRFAATEQCVWRQRLLQGQVHDENAFAVGGVAGHAGLFGTARAVGRLVMALWAAWQGRCAAGVFEAPVIRRFLTPPQFGLRPLGFDCPLETGSSAGDYFSPDSVGHLGFTGTSFWLDLRRQVGVVLLTNRIHPSRGNERIRRFRPLIHNRLMEAIKAS